MVDALFDIGTDFRILATLGRTELLLARDLLAETDTTRAMNTAGHIGRDQRADILVFDDAFAVVVTRNIPAVAHRDILQLALATLVANRAVQRMIDEQEFHRRLLRSDGLRGFRKNLHALADRCRTGWHRLGRFLHFDQAHAAVGRDAQLLVVAEPWNVSADFIGHFDDHLAPARLYRLAVDLNIYYVIAHGGLRSSLRGAIDNTAPMIADHVFEFVVVVVEETLHRPGCGVTQCTNSVAFNFVLCRRRCA